MHYKDNLFGIPAELVLLLGLMLACSCEMMREREEGGGGLVAVKICLLRAYLTCIMLLIIVPLSL